jgi:DNA-binding CsgD family transcriptional regulator
MWSFGGSGITIDRDPTDTPHDGRTAGTGAAVAEGSATGATAVAERPYGGPPGGAGLVARIAADPRAPLAAAIVGPGGTGKTMLLDELVAVYERAGVPVVRYPADPDVDGGVVLVDDAHRLTDADLDRLCRFAADPAARLVLAHRAWPRPRALAALTATLGQRRTVVMVGHLDRDAVAGRIAERVGGRAPESMAEFVHEQSGGLPGLVDLVTHALRESGRFDPRRPDLFDRPDRITVSAAFAERLRHRVDALEPAVHDLLEAMALGAALDSEVLGTLLAGSPAAAIDDAVEAARATGLLRDTGELIPIIQELFVRLVPVLRRRELQCRLAAIELDRGGSVLVAGRRLLGTGAGGDRVGAVLEAAAAEALADSPALAAELLAGAVAAGRPARALAGRRARAAALAGDLDTALRVADEVVADPDAPDHARAVETAAAVLAHRGLLAGSADLYRSLSPSSALLGVPALVITGALEDARRTVAAAAAGPHAGTLLAGAAALMADGMIATVTGSAPAALSLLSRAAGLLEPVAPGVLLPDTPAALTAVVALQCGELSVAADALRRAVEGRHGGRPAQLRHRLLHGWVLLDGGRVGAVKRLLDRVTGADVRLEPRDEFVAAALGVALARRTESPGALATAWTRARDALVRYPVELSTLRQLGELAVAAAALGEADRLAAHLDEAERLLDRLGRPALWSAPLHWARLQAAVAADQPDEVDRQLAELAATSPYTAVLEGAGTGWAQVLAGHADPDALVVLGRRMQAVGLGWEAAQLVARAAPLVPERRAAAALQAFARALVPGTAPEAAEPATVADPEPAAPAAEDDGQVFSERELEIGRLILAGLTYKQIGPRLYISAKTVEHHVARMRQRLGVASREELFDHLRAALS